LGLTPNTEPETKWKLAFVGRYFASLTFGRNYEFDLKAIKFLASINALDLFNIYKSHIRGDNHYTALYSAAICGSMAVIRLGLFADQRWDWTNTLEIAGIAHGAAIVI